MNGAKETVIRINREMAIKINASQTWDASLIKASR